MGKDVPQKSLQELREQLGLPPEGGVIKPEEIDTVVATSLNSEQSYDASGSIVDASTNSGKRDLPTQTLDQSVTDNRRRARRRDMQ